MHRTWRQSDALLPCQANPDLFFSEAPERLRQAQQLCGRCLLRSACLAGALQRAEPWGVWGGKLFHNGAIIASKRGPGRPRKSGVAA